MGAHPPSRVHPPTRTHAPTRAQRSAGRAPARPSRLDRTRLGARAANRPQAPWAPVPVSEILIGCGLLLLIVGFARGPDTGAALIAIGVLMATGGVIELCAREHFSGYRSHVLLLAFLPVVAAHTVLRVAITDAWEGPVALLVDAAVFAVLCLVLLDRYRAAQRRLRS